MVATGECLDPRDAERLARSAAVRGRPMPNITALPEFAQAAAVLSKVVLSELDRTTTLFIEEARQELRDRMRIRRMSLENNYKNRRQTAERRLTKIECLYSADPRKPGIKGLVEVAKAKIKKIDECYDKQKAHIQALLDSQVEEDLWCALVYVDRSSA